MNFGQMYSYHVLLLAAVVALVIAHVLLARRHWIVRAVRSQRQSDPCC
jgi:quinol-cytochrome oxidoreductase complex cytochrome b subunit